MIIFATIYNIAAVVLPMWSMNMTVNSALSSEVSSTNFKAGLLGFCVDSEFTNASTVLDHCFHCKFGSSYDDLAVFNTEIWSKYSSDGVRSGYSNAGDVSDDERLKYVTVIAMAAGMNAKSFDKFLDNCWARPPWRSAA